MLNLALSLAASLTVVLVCAAMANQLRLDRAQRPEPRHRPTLALPAAPTPEPEPEVEPEIPFDPLDDRFPIEEVERFLAGLEASRLAQLVTISAPPAPSMDDTRELEPIA